MMYTSTNKNIQNKDRLATKNMSHEQLKTVSTYQFVDQRPRAANHKELQNLANQSSQTLQAVQMQVLANKNTNSQETIQKKENNTGLPHHLKAGIESLSGYAMDDVKVHYNSARPAQLQAKAYAQGSSIHLGPGQEKHLPHEAWHVIQQKQGRVKPTLQIKGGVSVNDDKHLENEADVMGAKAIQQKKLDQKGIVGKSLTTSKIFQRKHKEDDKYNSELSKIIVSMKKMRTLEELKSNPDALKELAHYILKATEVLEGSDNEAKKALVEGAKTGGTTNSLGEKPNPIDPSIQRKSNNQFPIQRFLGLAIAGGVLAAAGIGYGIYKIIQNHGQRAQLPTGMQDIPTTRAAFGRAARYGGLTTGELTNEEIGQEVGRRTSHNHEILYRQLQEEGAPKDIAQLIQDVRDDNNIAQGPVCHDLTYFLVHRRIHKRPRLSDLRKLTGAAVIKYDLNSRDSLEDLLKGQLPGTSVWLGSGDAMSGHSFTVVGESGGRVIVADRHPANPIAALKYASTVEAEARLARHNHPKQRGIIDSEFSGSLVLHNFKKGDIK